MQKHRKFKKRTQNATFWVIVKHCNVEYISDAKTEIIQLNWAFENSHKFWIVSNIDPY